MPATEISRRCFVILGFIRPELKELEDVKEVWLSLPLVRTRKQEEGTSNEVTGSEVTSKKGERTSKIDSTVNSTVKNLENILKSNDMTDIQLLILQKMADNPNITIAELSTVTELDRNAVNYQLKKLRKIIKIERSGSDKKGSWIISPL